MSYVNWEYGLLCLFKLRMELKITGLIFNAKLQQMLALVNFTKLG